MIRFPYEVEVSEVVRRYDNGFRWLEPAVTLPNHRRTEHALGHGAWYWAPKQLAWLYRLLPRSVGWKPFAADWRHAQFQWSVYATAWGVGGWFWPLGITLRVGAWGGAWYSRGYCAGRTGSMKLPWWGLVRWGRDY